MNKIFSFICTFFLLIHSLNGVYEPSLYEKLFEAMKHKDYLKMEEVLGKTDRWEISEYNYFHGVAKEPVERDKIYEGLSLLNIAVLLNDKKALKLLIKACPDYINRKSFHDEGVPLYYASKTNNFDLVAFLLKKGADIDGFGSDKERTIKKLQQQTSWVQSTPLEAACDNRLYDMIEFLLEQGASLETGGLLISRVLVNGLEQGEIEETLKILELLFSHAKKSEFESIWNSRIMNSLYLGIVSDIILVRTQDLKKWNTLTPTGRANLDTFVATFKPLFSELEGGRYTSFDLYCKNLAAFKGAICLKNNYQ